MKTVLIGIYLLFSLPLFGQRYLLLESMTSFYSSAPVEDITARTTKTRSIFIAETGELAFVVPINTFEFEKKLMQEHFNENYMESHKFPEATFKGKLTGFNLQHKGVQKVMARGELNIHGVSRSVAVEGTLEFRGNDVYLLAKFPVRLADHKVEIPRLVIYNIAEVVEVTFKGKYIPHEKK